MELLKISFESHSSSPIAYYIESSIARFIMAREYFKYEIEDQIRAEGFAAEVIIQTRNKRITCPAEIDENGVIYIQQSYLKYIWTICYAFIVAIHEKDNLDSEIVADAYRLLGHGMSLFESGKDWPLDLPNPKYLTPDIEDYIATATIIFFMHPFFLFIMNMLISTIMTLILTMTKMLSLERTCLLIFY